MADSRDGGILDRDVLAAISQALFLAERYYSDPEAKVKGMFPATPGLRAQRLQGIETAAAVLDRLALIR